MRLRFAPPPDGIDLGPCQGAAAAHGATRPTRLPAYAISEAFVTGKTVATDPGSMRPIANRGF
jgi:hypothetical protein